LVPLIDWMDHYAVFWRDRFAGLRALLKEIDRGRGKTSLQPSG
jgi:hypothetical protein